VDGRKANITIRPAVDSDSAALVRILAPEVSKGVVVNRFAELHAGLRLLLVIEADGIITGTVSMSPKPDEDGVTRRLFALDIGSTYRRRGMATLLIEDVEQRVLASGHTVLRLEVSVDNHRAVSLYEKLGYERTGQPQKLQWSQQVDGHPSEIVTETSQRMLKRLN
jgi:N-acetylglutamate synthase-like GNAT family acetyltransferase